MTYTSMKVSWAPKVKLRDQNAPKENRWDEEDANEVKTVMNHYDDGLLDLQSQIDGLVDVPMADKTQDANITFASMPGQVYNMNGAARSGNITLDGTGAISGSRTVIRHNDNQAPTVGSLAGQTIALTYIGPGIILSDEYVIGQNNYILFECWNVSGTPFITYRLLKGFATGSSQGGGGSFDPSLLISTDPGNISMLGSDNKVLTVPNILQGATSQQAGAAGYVPQPLAGDQEDVLHGDGSWRPKGIPQTGYFVFEDTTPKGYGQAIWIDTNYQNQNNNSLTDGVLNVSSGVQFSGGYFQKLSVPLTTGSFKKIRIAASNTSRGVNPFIRVLRDGYQIWNHEIDVATDFPSGSGFVTKEYDLVFTCNTTDGKDYVIEVFTQPGSGSLFFAEVDVTGAARYADEVWRNPDGTYTDKATSNPRTLQPTEAFVYDLIHRAPETLWVTRQGVTYKFNEEYGGKNQVDLLPDNLPPTDTVPFLINQEILENLSKDVPQIVNSTRNNLEPGYYLLDSSSGPFTISLAQVKGIWRFANPKETLAANSVTVSSSGGKTFTVSGGNQVASDQILNEDGLQIIFTNPNAGTSYYVARAASAPTALLYKHNGFWNPDTNTPDLTVAGNRVGAGGELFVYAISTDGTVDIGQGSILYEEGGEIRFFDVSNFRYDTPAQVVNDGVLGNFGSADGDYAVGKKWSGETLQSWRSQYRGYFNSGSLDLQQLLVSIEAEYGFIEEAVTLSNAPNSATSLAAIFHAEGDATDGAIYLHVFTGGDDLVGLWTLRRASSVWGSWERIKHDIFEPTVDGLELVPGFSYKILDGHNVVLPGEDNVQSVIRLIPDTEWANVGGITSTNGHTVDLQPLVGTQEAVYHHDNVGQEWRCKFYNDGITGGYNPALDSANSNTIDFAETVQYRNRLSPMSGTITLDLSGLPNKSGVARGCAVLFYGATAPVIEFAPGSKAYLVDLGKKGQNDIETAHDPSSLNEISFFVVGTEDGNTAYDYEVQVSHLGYPHNKRISSTEEILVWNPDQVTGVTQSLSGKELTAGTPDQAWGVEGVQALYQIEDGEDFELELTVDTSSSNSFVGIALQDVGTPDFGLNGNDIFVYGRDSGDIFVYDTQNSVSNQAIAVGFDRNTDVIFIRVQGTTLTIGTKTSGVDNSPVYTDTITTQAFVPVFKVRGGGRKAQIIKKSL